MDYSFRRATLDDIEMIVAHRRAMILEIRQCDEAALDGMTALFRAWLEKKLIADEYLGWLAVGSDDAIAAGVGLWIIDWPPHVRPNGIPGDRRGYILNVYTEPDHRLRGISRMLMNAALAWCREHDIPTLSLHASPYGRALYESLGFAQTNEMRISLEI